MGSSQDQLTNSFWESLFFQDALVEYDNFSNKVLYKSLLEESSAFKIWLTPVSLQKMKVLNVPELSLDL